MAKQTQHIFSGEESFILDYIKGINPVYDNNFSTEKAHQFALKNGLSPYLFHLLKENKSSVPPELYGLIKTDYLNTFIRFTKIQNVWKELQRIFSDKQLPFVPLKGIFLANFIYPDPCIRPMSDLDILLFKGNTQKAFDLLLKYGGNIDKEETAEHDKKTGHHLQGIVFKGVLIELHTSLFPLDVDYQIPNKKIENSLISYNGINTLPPMLNLCYLCLHAHSTMRRGGIRLSWFLDLILLSQSSYFKLNSTTFEDTINELGIALPVLDVLNKTEFLFDYHFDFIPDTARTKLTEKEIAHFIGFIQKSDQQNTSYSYNIAFERLKNTKGIHNKITFIKSVILRGNKTDFISLSKRLFILIKRIGGMFFSKR